MGRKRVAMGRKLYNMGRVVLYWKLMTYIISQIDDQLNKTFEFKRIGYYISNFIYDK